MSKTVLEKMIDVSRYNGTIDFSKVKANGITGVIIRVGYRGYSKGNVVADDKYFTNIKNAVASGLKVGIYFMSQAITESEAFAEAEYCVSQVKDYDIHYPIAYDSEWSSNAKTGRADSLTKAQRTAICKAFCERVCELGYKSSVYASKSWYSTNLDVAQLCGYYIWVAQYNSLCTYTLTDYNIWQYSSKCVVNGISGNVDMNEVYTDFATSEKASGITQESVLEVKSGINTYSKSADGDKTFTISGIKTNFKVKEFSCNDGSDSILIDSEMVKKVQAIRNHFGKPVSINSAYRTVTYNKKIGGATNSYHAKGQACDIKITGATPLEVAKYAQSIGMLGIGQYGTFTHIDTRTSKYYWNSTSGTEKEIESFVYTAHPVLKVGSKGTDVSYLQSKLTEKGYALISDGNFGAKTKAAVSKFQNASKLISDGIVGVKTWGILN